MDDEIIDDIVYEQPETASEIIVASLNSLTVCDSYDYGMISKEEQQMIDEIKSWALVLVHTSLKAIYDTNIETE